MVIRPNTLLTLLLAATATTPLVVQSTAQTVPPALFSDMDWRLIGPFRAGRAVAVAGIPGDGTIFYFGAVDGGIWKTSNAGTTWKPIFDGQPVASIGALAVAPSNPSILYAGTGETDIRSNLASGAGVFRSSDGGSTWKYVGLKETRQIARILVDPTNPDIVYVGALGHAYGPNAERGVYKSNDGGVTWKHVLDKGPETGVADMAIAAANPKILFASLWNAHRPPWSTYAPIAGPGSGLYRSNDGGETWQPCTGHGLPEGKWGRSGVAVSSDGMKVYALVEAAKSGLYVSSDGGQNWSLASADPRLTSRAWYFSRITVDPSDANTIYMPNIALMGSTDGGKTINVVRGAPGGDDYHELWVDPKNGSRLLLATDQGTSISLDKGKTWSTWYNQPTAQLYHVTTDDKFPYTVYGSQQDSGGVAVLSRTDHGPITPRDWFPASGSESGQMAIDPRDNDILYVSGGYGTVSRWDKRRALAQDITPWPVPVFGTEISERRYRDPWTPPLVFSTVDKISLYLGTRYVSRPRTAASTGARSAPTSRAAPTSSNPPPSLARGILPPETRSPKSEAPTPDTAIAKGYGTLATVAPSYIDKDVIWAGSDTGIISVTRDGGKSWQNVTPPEMKAPGKAWGRVSLIDPSHFDAGTAYASIERHRMDDQSPYLYRTSDFGKTWQSITSGLAAPAFVNAIREDPGYPGLLYAGTEFGIYVSFNDGANWQPLQLNLPVTSIRDIDVPGDDLIVATHGRSFWILDDITPLREIAGRMARPMASRPMASTPLLFPPAVTIRIDNDAFAGTPLPPEEPTAENPPAGAILDYYLPAEAKLVELSIYTQDHKLIRRFTSVPGLTPDHVSLPIAERWFPKPSRLETAPGMHRIVWNLAWGTSGVAESDEPDDGEGTVPRGPKVAPGTYTLELTADGTALPPQSLIIVDDPRSPATPAELQQNFAATYSIFTDSLESRRALAEIASVQEQLVRLAIPNKPLSTSIEAILAGSDKSIGLEQANTELTAALNVAESSDRSIPSQALQVYAEARAASIVRVKEWDFLKKGTLAKFNEQLKSQNQKPIAISAIEHEVQVLMTQ